MEHCSWNTVPNHVLKEQNWNRVYFGGTGTGFKINPVLGTGTGTEFQNFGTWINVVYCDSERLHLGSYR